MFVCFVLIHNSMPMFTGYDRNIKTYVMNIFLCNGTCSFHQGRSQEFVTGGLKPINVFLSFFPLPEAGVRGYFTPGKLFDFYIAVGEF